MFYFRRHVYDNEAFRQFLHSSSAVEGVRSRMWTAEGVLTVWALLSVPAKRWRDIGSVVRVRAKDIPLDGAGELAAAFPLNEQLRSVRDIMKEDSRSTQLVAVSLSAAARKPFRTPPPLWNETCYQLSPQMWPACLPTLLDRFAVPEWLKLHEYERNSAHAAGYENLHEFLSSQLRQFQRDTDRDRGRGAEYQGERAGERTGMEMSYVVKIRGAYVDGNGVHAAAYGTVFDAGRMLQPQPHVKDACTHYLSRRHLRFRHIPRLIVGNNVVYPTSYGHFLHEILPRVIWMAQSLPIDIPILMVLSEQIVEVMGMLEANGVPVPRSRLIHWENDMVLYGRWGIRRGRDGQL